jgi:hypothetical protein
VQRNYSWDDLVQQQLNYLGDYLGDYLGAAFDAAQRQWRSATVLNVKGIWSESSQQWLKDSLPEPINDAENRFA